MVLVGFLSRDDGQHLALLELQDSGHTRPQHARDHPRAVCVMLIFLYSQYVLLAIVVGYILLRLAFADGRHLLAP